jgi:hypothetical protein
VGCVFDWSAIRGNRAGPSIPWHTDGSQRREVANIADTAACDDDCGIRTSCDTEFRTRGPCALTTAGFGVPLALNTARALPTRNDCGLGNDFDFDHGIARCELIAALAEAGAVSALVWHCSGSRFQYGTNRESKRQETWIPDRRAWRGQSDTRAAP